MKLKTSHIFFLLLAIIGMNYIPTTKAYDCDTTTQYGYRYGSSSTKYQYFTPDRYFEVYVTLKVQEIRTLTYYGSNCQYIQYGPWSVNNYWDQNLYDYFEAGIITSVFFPIIKDDGFDNDGNPWVLAKTVGKERIFTPYDNAEVRVLWDIEDREFQTAHWNNGHPRYP